MYWVEMDCLLFNTHTYLYTGFSRAFFASGFCTTLSGSVWIRAVAGLYALRHLHVSLLPTLELRLPFSFFSLRLTRVAACSCLAIWTLLFPLSPPSTLSPFPPPSSTRPPRPPRPTNRKTQVCLTYAIVNPFILVVGIPYFFSCQLTYKHQMLFVYEPLYETGGVFFPKIFRRFIFALIIAQVVR